MGMREQRFCRLYHNRGLSKIEKSNSLIAFGCPTHIQSLDDISRKLHEKIDHRTWKGVLQEGTSRIE